MSMEINEEHKVNKAKACRKNFYSMVGSTEDILFDVR
jgi:hypothetical protein